ncbi:hypothetical protein B2J93_4087 [Marssonina coronariae]|uniref:Uncharacterized protein n=1 Tax=Diplocarpon coronariae TaxID=2795749 RepID=A0A218ZBZ2_9HELO|nr:hypothetical protein B2J93_4087 [Marssonina coronariae]
MSAPTDDTEEKKMAAEVLLQERFQQLRQDSRFSMPFGMRLSIATSISFASGLLLGISHGSQMAGFRFRAENAHRLPTTPTGWYLYHKSKNYNMALAGVKEGLKMGAKVSFWTAGFFSIEDVFDRYRGTKDCLNTVLASLSVAGAFSLWNATAGVKLSRIQELRAVLRRFGYMHRVFDPSFISLSLISPSISSSFISPSLPISMPIPFPFPSPSPTALSRALPLRPHRLTTTDRFPITTAARTAKTGLAIGLAYGLAQDTVGALRGRYPRDASPFRSAGSKPDPTRETA